MTPQCRLIASLKSCRRHSVVIVSLALVLCLAWSSDRVVTTVEAQPPKLHHLAWATPMQRGLSYAVTWEIDLENGHYLEKRKVKLHFTFGSGRTTTVKAGQKSSKPVVLAVDGSFRPLDADMPLEAWFLLLASPPVTSDQPEGAKWVVRAPKDTDLGNDRIELQIEHRTQLLSENAGLVQLEIEGWRRVIDNPEIEGLLGLPSAEPDKKAAAAALATLSKWIPYLKGTVWWNEKLGAPEKADFECLPWLAVIPTVDSVSSNVSRQHITFQRMP